MESQNQDQEHEHEEVWERKRTLKVSSGGFILTNVRFYFHLLIVLISLFIFIATSSMNYWPTLCKSNHWALYAYVGGLYTVTIFSTCSLISWIAVRDCSWYLTSPLLFIVSILLIVSGLVYFVDYTVPSTICSFCDSVEENEKVVEKTTVLPARVKSLSPSVEPSTENVQTLPPVEVKKPRPKVWKIDVNSNYEKTKTNLARRKRKSFEEPEHKKSMCMKKYDSYSTWTIALVGLSFFLGFICLCVGIAVCLNAILYKDKDPL